MHAASEINNSKCMIKHLHFQCFCYCDLSKSLTVAGQLVHLHLITWSQETVIHNSRFVLYIETVLVLYTHWRVITACYNSIHWVSYYSHESSSRRTLLTRLTQPFLHIRSFCIHPPELNVRLDEGKQLDPCVPIPYCSLWLHWNSRCLVQIFGSCFPNRESHFCRDSRHV